MLYSMQDTKTPFRPYTAMPTVPTTVPELQDALRQALKDNERLTKELHAVNATDTGIINWLSSHASIVEVKVYHKNVNPSDGRNLKCWHFIALSGKKIRDEFCARMQQHGH